MLDKLEWDIFHYSKRQMMWFKRNSEIKWFPLDSLKKIPPVVKRFLS